MSDIYELSAETRKENGKASSRRLRRLENKIPAIIYGGKEDPLMVSLDHNSFINALENEAFYSHILTLSVDGKKEKVVLKDLHRHPSRPRILHADFMRISGNQRITMNVPLHFTGAESAPSVKKQGGAVSHLMNEIEIRCLPDKLPEFIEVDLSSLKIGEIIHLSDIKLPQGVELTVNKDDAKDQPVASIHKTAGSSADSNEDKNTEASSEG